MVSRIGSQGYTQNTNRVQQSNTQPQEARQRPFTQESRQPATREAAVVKIGVDARARAAASEPQNAAEPVLGASAETATEVNIEPVPQQPVPDFHTKPNDVSGFVSNGSSAQLYRSSQAVNSYQANNSSTGGYTAVA